MKSKLRSDFLSQFTYAYQQQIIEYAERISNIKCDVMIFMARKAVCFYECINILGLSKVSTITTSDRIFDMDLNWLAGKSVALVDDALISGTTLARLEQVTLAAGAIDVKTYVFCIDTQWWASQLVVPSEPFLRLDNSDTTAFCSQLVRAISCLPHPYAVDYPTFGGLHLKNTADASTFSIPGWITRDISTPLQYSKGISVLVIEPDEITSQRVQKLIGLKTANKNRLLKLRLYGRINNESNHTGYRIMPIFAAETLPESTLETWWESITGGERNQFFSDAKKLFTSTTSKLRLIQFILATRLIKLWVNELKPYIDLEGRLDFDFASIRYAFSPEITPSINKICQFTENSPLENLVSPNAPPPIKLPKKIGNNCELSHLELQRTLINPFIELHDNEEIPARVKTLSLSKEEFLENKSDHDVLRLQRGYSVSDLNNLIPDNWLIDSNLAISLFLDNAIDRGFIVPITVNKDGYVYRAYRHGEDIKDAQQFEYLTFKCVNEFLMAANETELYPIWLEKLQVLLLQQLVEKHIIPPSDLSLGWDGTIGVRYAAFGPIIKTGASKIFSHYEGEYFTKRLEQGKIIINHNSPPRQDSLFEDGSANYGTEPKSHKRKLYRVGEPPQYVPNNFEGQSVASEVGRTLGTLKNGFHGVKLNSDDLVYLLTSLTLETLGPATAVELDIFRREWLSHGRLLALTYEKAIAYFSDNTALKRHIGIRNDLSYDAITSGKRKSLAYFSGSAQSLLTDIEKQLEKLSTLTSGEKPDDVQRLASYLLSDWRKLWQSKIFGIHYSKDSVGYIEALKISILIYQINILLRTLEISLDQVESNRNKYKLELNSLIVEINLFKSGTSYNPNDATYNASINEVVAQAKNVLERDISKESMDLTYRESILSIGKCIQQIPERLDSADLIYSNFGKPHDIIRQRHLLLIEYRTNETLQSNPIYSIKKILKQITSDSSIFITQSFIGKGESITLFSNTADGLKSLAQLAFTILKQSWSKRYISSIWLLPEIPREERPAVDTITNDLRGCCLSQRISSVKNLFPSNNTPNEQIRFIIPETAGSVLKQIAPEKFSLTLNQQRSITLKDPFDRSYVISDYKYMTSKKEPKKTVDVLIISVTATEHSGIINIIKDYPNFLEVARHEEFEFSAQGYNASTFFVKYIPLFQQGNVASAAAITNLTAIHKPKLVAIVGMAGGIGLSNESARILDVIIASQVIYYESASDNENGLRRRGDVFNLDQKIHRAVDALISEGLGGCLELPSSDSDGKANVYRVRSSPILTGEKIVKFQEAQVRKWAQQFNDKVEAVETEAWGTICATDRAYDFSSSRSRHKARSVIFRGIADKGDEAKNKHDQKQATEHATLTLLKFLSSIEPSYLNWN